MQKSETLNDHALLHSLAEGRLDVLDDIYFRYRADFLRWARGRFKATPNDLEDAWQDAVIALYERTVSDKPIHFRCALRTYLFAIGAKRLLQNYRKMRRFLWKDEIDKVFLQESEVLTFEWETSPQEMQERLLASMDYLGPQCRDLLLSRYYDGKNLEELQRQFQYQNLNTVSASISRCLKQLKTLVEANLTL